MPEHKDITDPNIHETKGASTASAGQVLTATGSGTATFQNPTVYSNVKVGSYRIGNTNLTPVALTTAGTYYTLVNNAGVYLSTYGISGVSSVWDNVNNRFDLSSFVLGDVMIFYFDVNVTTTTSNTALDIDLELGIGGTIVTIPVQTQLNIKTASTVRITGQRIIPLFDNNLKDYPARIKAKADTTGATVLVNEFSLGVIKRG